MSDIKKVGFVKLKILKCKDNDYYTLPYNLELYKTPYKKCKDYIIVILLLFYVFIILCCYYLFTLNFL